MPTYDYTCPHCKKKFDALVTIKERDTVACPTCKHKATRLLTTTPWHIVQHKG